VSYRNRAVARSLPDFPRPHQPPSGNMDKPVRQLDGEPLAAAVVWIGLPEGSHARYNNNLFPTASTLGRCSLLP
jgi:hypothetical protein